MNCELNCPRAYTSPQGDSKCIMTSDDKSSVILEIEANKPQKHWLCEKSPKSMKLSTVDSEPNGFVLRKKEVK